MLKRVQYIEFLYIILPLVFIILAPIGLILQFIRFSRDYKSELFPFRYISQGIYHNLLGKPISDLQVKNLSEGNCSTGYNQLVITTWPGTKSGCYHKGNNILLDKSCQYLKKEAQDNEWEDILPYQTLPISEWNGYKLCVQYMAWKRINLTTLTCTSGYKPCSREQICVPATEECPITSVNFTWSDNGKELKVSIERESSKDAIIDIQTSINGMPCINPARVPKLAPNSSYPLEPNRWEGCDDFGENKFFTKKIYTKSLLQFYNENLFDQINKLPNYKDFLNKNSITLYSLTKIAVNKVPACHDLINALDVISTNIGEFTFSTKLTKSVATYHIATLLFAYLILFYFCLGKEPQERDKYFKEQKILINILHFLPYITCTFFIAQYSEVSEKGVPQSAQMIDSVLLIINNQCFNGTQYHFISAQLYQTLQGMIEYNYGVSKILGIMSYCLILVLLLTRGIRAYYLNEIDAYENSLLEHRFNISRPLEFAFSSSVGRTRAFEIEISEIFDAEFENDWHSLSSSN